MAKKLRALLIQFNEYTGKRAGNVNPNDPKLQCYGWQKLVGEDSLEIRLVEDDRDLSQYKDIKGITVLKGKEVINRAIRENTPDDKPNRGELK